MNLQQLRYLVAVRDSELNVTAAARALHTSQPAVSRQIQLLERELGSLLFERSGRSLARTTAIGDDIIARADSVLREVQNMRRASMEFNASDHGTLTIATTHTQARYVLPEVVKAFCRDYPKVRIHIHQGSTEQIAELMAKGRADFAIATGGTDLFPRVVRLPLYHWQLSVVVPRSHPLTKRKTITLADVARYPIVTYEFSLSSSSSLFGSFDQVGLRPEIALTAQDADVIKAYVRIGLGVGLMAPFAVDPAHDADLVVLSVPTLFVTHTSWIGFRFGALLNTYMRAFVHLLAPHLPIERVKRAQSESVSWDDIALPVREALSHRPTRALAAGKRIRAE